MKKILSILVCLCIICSMIPAFTVSAEDEPQWVASFGALKNPGTVVGDYIFTGNDIPGEKVYHNYTIDDFRKDVKKELERKDNMVFNSGNDALNYLVEKGRVTDKEYWEKVLDTTNKTEYLFMKWAEDYSKLVGE